MKPEEEVGDHRFPCPLSVLLLQELLPFAKRLFSTLFGVVFSDIDLRFDIFICLDVLKTS